ncbi:hypothetical protein C6A85_43830, partial [Mycobacterium sp. ITM-2017-0098]
FSAVLIAIAVRSASGTALMWLAVPAISAVFASSGAPPVELLPASIRPLVEFQPMATTIRAMRALAHGDPALSPLLLASIWGIGIA